MEYLLTLTENYKTLELVVLDNQNRIYSYNWMGIIILNVTTSEVKDIDFQFWFDGK